MQVADIELAEKDKMREKCQKIIKHGINCFINRQLIYNFPEEIFADAGVMSIEHADFDGIERLALVLGGEIASTFENPGDVKLGQCKLIEEIMIGEDRLIHFQGGCLAGAGGGRGASTQRGAGDGLSPVAMWLTGRVPQGGRQAYMLTRPCFLPQPLHAASKGHGGGLGEREWPSCRC